jgi:hypothetical protein
MWKRQAQQKIERPRAHRSEITGCARQRLIAHILRRMSAKEEVDVFEECVGRKHPLRAASGVHYGGIVSNPHA